MTNIRLIDGMLKLLVVLTLAGSLLVVACQKEDADSKPASARTDQFAGWQYYDYENVRILYPPGHQQFEQFEEIAAGYVSARIGICEVLKMEPPTDTLTVIFYLNYREGMDITGADHPFVQGDTIHFWIPAFYGQTLTEWLLPKWQPGPIKQKFLHEGLVTLFDHSGRDYHAATLAMIDSGTFVPLSTLAVYEGIDANSERTYSAEAASFCGFVLAWYGAEVMKGMYRYQYDFDGFSRGAFNLSVDSLQMLWLEVIRANQPDNTENENSN